MKQESTMGFIAPGWGFNSHAEALVPSGPKL
jgi:hypothetical protein